MLTFHNDPVQKIKYKTLYSDARESGHMMRGDYFNSHTQKGCLIGLATHGSYHEEFANESGIPEWLLRLAETCFEGLPEETFQEFPEKLMDAIPIGISHADLEIIKHKIAVFQIEEICCDVNHPLVKDAIYHIVTLHKNFIEGYPPTNEEWDSAHSAAYSAAYSARSAARSAADSARSAAHSADSAADSAAYSADSAADSAAYSARSAAHSADSAADSAARSAVSAARSKISEKLLTLLRELEKPLEEHPIKNYAGN